VSDDGTGMDEATLARVFEPFFSTKPMGEGSGLGLATVYGIVMHAGGVVHVYSEVGPGTTVSVWLPATTGTTPEPERHSARALTAQGETVLVVEDEEAIRELTRRVLVRNGYDVITAADGVEAIALAEHHAERIHLLLTDVIMPGLLGREIAQRIAAIRPGIRILFMSGYAGAVLSSQGSLDPGLTLLEKPFTEVVLLEHVRDVLDAPAAE
jgi:CheY-like chemotaxis protein